MSELLVWLIKFPFVLVAAVLVLTLTLVGGILALLGLVLTPVLGIGLLIIPIGLAFLLAAGVIAQVLKRKRTVVVYRYATTYLLLLDHHPKPRQRLS